ncbi:unnamed protein product [Kluyveromyces dobzhanskii CBS 2104]|uniref:WGS project CCBQ000000000 data, contig 00099 n=1 Tax=Kluyveromyces dobzhanskii CBS 2104 TaxID=1427455 RepID=A0A0A8L3W6_9SACH|nr:unnamed protein product [Kluyveromyces dobzhanskii CBS 2104]
MGLKTANRSVKKGNRVLLTSLGLFAVVLFIVFTFGNDGSLIDYKRFSTGGLQADELHESEVSASRISKEGDTMSTSLRSILANYAVASAEADSTAEKKMPLGVSELEKKKELREQKVLSPNTISPSESEVAPIVAPKVVQNSGSSGSIGFSGKHASEQFNPSLGFQEILTTSPVILFIKSSVQSSVDLKNILTLEYTFSPEVIVVDLDKHSHGESIQEYIQLNRLATYKSHYEESSKSPDVPYLFVNGVSLINKSLKSDLLNKHADGTLLSKLRYFADGKVSISKLDTPSNS